MFAPVLFGKQLLRRLRFGFAREFVIEDMLKLGTQFGQAGAGDAPKHRYVEIKVRMEPWLRSEIKRGHGISGCLA